jgi:hypothetical protein
VISVFDLFKIGIGPSSSHTVGPMRAAHIFVSGLKADGRLADAAMVRAELFGSLGATGHGHGSDKAVLLGLAGEDPETVDTATADERVRSIKVAGKVALLGVHEVEFDLIMHRRRSLPNHPNGMIFTAADGSGATIRQKTYYSVGGAAKQGPADERPHRPVGRTISGSAARLGLGDPFRARGQRGERGGRPGGDRAYQRGRGDHPGRAALLHKVRAGRLR